MNGWDKIKKDENDTLIILTHVGPALLSMCIKLY